MSVGVPAEVEAKLRAMVEDGRSRDEMAEALGYSRVTINQYLSRCGISGRKQWERAEDRRVQVEAMIAQGLTRRQMAEALGVKESTITSWLSRFGLNGEVPRATPRQARVEDNIDREAFEARWREGASNPELAREFQLARSAVSKIGRRLGLPPRKITRAQVTRRAKPKAPKQPRAHVLAPWEHEQRERRLDEEHVEAGCLRCDFRTTGTLREAKLAFDSHDCPARADAEAA